MSIKIEETFQIQAPVDRVWRYFVDPRQVVTCIPGAELTAVEGERTYTGRVKVKVGPVTAAYNGKATIVEQDDTAHVVRLVAEGRETAGSGSAKMTMTSRMTQRPDGATDVHVVADVDVVGKIVQFGRGMIESVNKQLFRQFTDCARSRLEVPEPAATPSAPADVAPAASPAPAARAASVPTAAPAAAPMKVLPLVLRALWDMVLRLFRRKPAAG